MSAPDATFTSEDRGAISVMFALMLPVLVGLVGLGVESGMWFSERRALQTLADTTAVSAAIENSYGGTNTDVLGAATDEARRNGLSDSSDTISYVGTPVSGPFTGDDDYVEVVVSRRLTTIMTQVLFPLNPVATARAVATTGQDTMGMGCVIALDATGPAIVVGGNGSVVFDGCDVVSNSTDMNALTVSGSGGLAVNCYAVAGQLNVTSGFNVSEDCIGAEHAPVTPDPYAHLADPDDGGCDAPNGYFHNKPTTVTIGHGSFTDPYVICGDFRAKRGTVILNGLIVIKGDFKANASAEVQSSPNGSTIVLKDGGRINKINGSASINLAAPAKGTGTMWDGVLFYQDRDSTPSCIGNNCNTLNGNASTSFQGLVYFPNQELRMTGGNSSVSTCFQIVAKRVSFSGNSAMLAHNDCMESGISPVPIPGPHYAVLVE